MAWTRMRQPCGCFPFTGKGLSAGLALFPVQDLADIDIRWYRCSTKHYTNTINQAIYTRIDGDWFGKVVSHLDDENQTPAQMAALAQLLYSWGARCFEVTNEFMQLYGKTAAQVAAYVNAVCDVLPSDAVIILGGDELSYQRQVHDAGIPERVIIAAHVYSEAIAGTLATVKEKWSRIFHEHTVIVTEVGVLPSETLTPAYGATRFAACNAGLVGIPWAIWPGTNENAATPYVGTPTDGTGLFNFSGVVAIGGVNVEAWYKRHTITNIRTALGVSFTNAEITLGG